MNTMINKTTISDIPYPQFDKIEKELLVAATQLPNCVISNFHVTSDESFGFNLNGFDFEASSSICKDTVKTLKGISSRYYRGWDIFTYDEEGWDVDTNISDLANISDIALRCLLFTIELAFSYKQHDHALYTSWEEEEKETI